MSISKVILALSANIRNFCLWAERLLAKLIPASTSHTSNPLTLCLCLVILILCIKKKNFRLCIY